MSYRPYSMSSLSCVLVYAGLTLGLQFGPQSPVLAGAGSEERFSKQTYIYKKVGNCEVKADVYRLPGDEVRPAILWIHGGALIFSDRGSVTDHQLQRYLRAGYVVISIDYRLAPETKLAAIIEDVQDAYQWVREKGPGEYHIDPDRIAVVGNSAGGYLTLMAGFCVKPRPRALVSFYGYGDITGEWTTRPAPHYAKFDAISKEDAYAVVGGEVLSGSSIFPRVTFYNYCRQNGLWLKEVAGIDPDKEPTREYPPTLLLHGAQLRSPVRRLPRGLAAEGEAD